MDLTGLDKLYRIPRFQSYKSEREERNSLWQPEIECIVYTVTFCIAWLWEREI